MKFLVFGGAGKTAQLFTKRAVAAGDEVISVVRSNKSDAALAALGSQPALCSLDNASVDEISALLKQHTPHVVLFAAGSPDGKDRDLCQVVDYQGAIKVYDAMEAAGVRRLVMLSSLDTRSQEEPRPDYYTPDSIEGSKAAWSELSEYLPAKFAADKNLHTRTKIEYTLVRPGWLLEEPAGGVKMGITQLRATSRDSAAQALLAVAHEPRTIGLTIDVVDGDGDMGDELQKVVEAGTDAWKTYGHL